MSLRTKKDVSLEDLQALYAREDFFLQPKFQELLYDAQFFLEKTVKEKDWYLRSRFGRACVVFSVAAIEAGSNDALVGIRDLFNDDWLCEDLKKAPWVIFRRLSPSKVRFLLSKGSLPKKIRYLRDRIERGAGKFLRQDFDYRLKQAVKIRNRMMHMESLNKPKNIPAILNAQQISHTAKIALGTADEYLDYLQAGFSEMKLRIESYPKTK